MDAGEPGMKMDEIVLIPEEGDGQYAMDAQDCGSGQGDPGRAASFHRGDAAAEQASRGWSDDSPLAGASSGVSLHTGFPNAAADRRLRGLDLNQLLVRHPSSTFMFRIRGERGIMQGIFDGDIAIVDRIAAPRGQDLVLWHDGRQFNLSRPTRIASGSAVWGTITAVIHQYREGVDSSKQ